SASSGNVAAVFGLAARRSWGRRCCPRRPPRRWGSLASRSSVRVAAAFIAGMAEAGERAVAAFKVSGADVIEDQGALGKMTFGESVFDFLLTQKQPIHGVIELGFLDGGVQTEHGRQRGGGGIGMKAAGSSEFGGG